MHSYPEEAEESTMLSRTSEPAVGAGRGRGGGASQRRGVRWEMEGFPGEGMMIQRKGGFQLK